MKDLAFENFIFQQRGIGPRIISDLLETKTKYEHEYNIEFGMSYCEIRGTELYDLLNPDDNSNKINVSKYRKFDNITLMIVTSEEQVLNHLFQGMNSLIKPPSYHIRQSA